MQQHATCHVTEHILYLYFPVVVLVLTIPFPLGIQQYIFNLNFKFCFGAELLFAIIEVLSSPYIHPDLRALLISIKWLFMVLKILLGNTGESLCCLSP